MKIITSTEKRHHSTVILETYAEVSATARHLNPPIRRYAALLGAVSASSWLEPTSEATQDEFGKWLPLITPESVPDARLANATHALLNASMRTGGSVDPVADRELANRINTHLAAQPASA